MSERERDRISDERVEAIRKEVRDGRPEGQKGRIDPLDVAEFKRDALAGRERRPEAWRQVMERHGFRWYEPAELDVLIGPQKYIPPQIEGMANEALYWTRPHSEGQWRRPEHSRNMLAFTLADLIGLYGTPEAFALWVEDRDSRRAAARLGIKLMPAGAARRARS